MILDMQPGALSKLSRVSPSAFALANSPIYSFYSSIFDE